MGSLILTVESSITDQVDTINKTAQLLENMVPVIESSIEKIGAQSTAVDTTSKGITDIIHAIEVIDRSAAREEDIYKDIVVMIESGSAMLENSITAMQAIEETSHKITDIVGIIANIADSTNTLAINAAIEAAHAGEFGKGFAIVSQEIRSLAEGTSQSTDTIETLIDDMTQKISNGVSAFAEFKNILEKMISECVRRTL
jgi:methyl-accepting chemotaxis protein